MQPTPAAASRPNEVFLSYSRQNEGFVGRLRDSMQRHGIEPWYDREDIRASANWWEEIRKGIETANVFVPVISPDFLASRVCHWETAYAISLQKKIVPVQYSDVFKSGALSQLAGQEWQTPEGLRVAALANWRRLESHNFITVQDENAPEGLLRQLATAIRLDLAHVDEHTRLTVRARDWEQHRRDRSYVLRGSDLQTATTWLAQSTGKDPAPSLLHIQYIQASQEAARLRQRLVTIAVSVALLIMAGLAGLAFVQFQEAQEQRDIAYQERDRADRERLYNISLRYGVQAQRILDQTTDAQSAQLAALISIQGLNLAYSPEADTALVTATERFAPRNFELSGTVNMVDTVATSPDGNLTASGERNGKVRLTKAQSDELVRYFVAHDRAIDAVVFTNDSAFLVTRSVRGEVRVWDTDIRQLIDFACSRLPRDLTDAERLQYDIGGGRVTCG